MHIFCAHPEFSDQTRARCVLRCLLRTHSFAKQSLCVCFASIPFDYQSSISTLKSSPSGSSPHHQFFRIPSASSLRRFLIFSSSIRLRISARSILRVKSGWRDFMPRSRIPSKGLQNGCPMKFSFISVLLQSILQSHVI